MQGGLLVVEDDQVIGDTLVRSLTAHGHRVDWAVTAAEALDAVRTTEYALILLDLGLPDLDGVEVARRVRALRPACVIVMLTARQDEIDVVLGLEAGADDYLPKPFRLAELLARVRAHLRRGPATRPDERLPDRVQVGALTVDTAARRCLVGLTEVLLRAREYDVLARLVFSVGEAVSRETLMNDVWDENWFGSTKTLDVHIAAVRRRLADAGVRAGVSPPTISTLRGHGYRLEKTE
ncbi:response regulator transcription factor [Fodinicola feengrottensis]|uniref:Response regulator transcription factor n=1 Tax=Fodinicola feengrottensis TaxID=435914 RepID=A0ABN2IWZ0_9ACTN|nr:response regulator transcription factor [Fodinicola feengrottensis]